MSDKKTMFKTDMTIKPGEVGIKSLHELPLSEVLSLPQVPVDGRYVAECKFCDWRVAYRSKAERYEGSYDHINDHPLH